MKIAADELKTDKRRWFPTECVIKLQNSLPQEFKEPKHYISVKGNCFFVEESSNTYLFLFRKSCFCKLLGDQGIFSGSFAVYLWCSCMLHSWLLLARGYMNGHGPLDLAQYSHYCVPKPAPFLCSFLCETLCMPPKYKISEIQNLIVFRPGQDCRYVSVNGLIS